MEAIREFRGKYLFLSNFSYYACYVGGTLYPTVEHAYQACKSEDPNLRLIIGSALTPALAKKYGRTAKLRPDWEKIKVKVMELCLRRKYERSPKARKLLIATGDALLEEGNHWGDTFWGVCGGVGENHLGKLHMKIREELQNEEVN